MSGYNVSDHRQRLGFDGEPLLVDRPIPGDQPPGGPERVGAGEIAVGATGPGFGSAQHVRVVGTDGSNVNALTDDNGGFNFEENGNSRYINENTTYSILVTKDGLAKLADLGLVKDDETMGLTLEGATLGTPYYIPPEQATGECLIYEEQFRTHVYGSVEHGPEWALLDRWTAAFGDIEGPLRRVAGRSGRGRHYHESSRLASRAIEQPSLEGQVINNLKA